MNRVPLLFLYDPYLNHYFYNYHNFYSDQPPSQVAPILVITCPQMTDSHRDENPSYHSYHGPLLVPLLLAVMMLVVVVWWCGSFYWRYRSLPHCESRSKG